MKRIGQEGNVCTESFQNQRTEYVGSSSVGKQEWDVNRCFGWGLICVSVTSSFVVMRRRLWEGGHRHSSSCCWFGVLGRIRRRVA